MKNLIFITIATLFISAIFTFPVSASITDGTIDPNSEGYKYAWGENVGWINFGTSNGDVHITDSGLSGYALGENTGWVYLDDVSNDGEGNLSGYAWSENTGWIKFNPDNGGVVINSSGEFAGSALGENIGWITFDCNTAACVKTDWRPQSARPACNNAIDDDGDGKTDYPNDPGCDSLTDTDETDPAAAPAPSGGGGGSTCVGPRTFSDSLVINQGQEYVSLREVELKLKADSALYMSICNDSQFIGCSLETYSTSKSWTLTEGDGQKTVYAIFVSSCGRNSVTVSDTIILDTTAPEIKITEVKDYYSSAEDVVLTVKTEAGAEIILHWDEKYGLIHADEQGKVTINLGKMSAGTYQLEVTSKDLAGNKSEPLIIELTIKSAEVAEVPEEIPEEVPPEEVPEVTPEKPEKPIIEKVLEILKPLIPEFLKPEEKEEEKPEEMIVIPEKAPLAFQGKWDLLSPKAIGGFVLAPLPKEIRVLAQKFPELGKTFEEVGISKITDVEKLKTAKLTLPGLTERVGLPTTKIEPGKFALPQGVPVAELSPEVKEQIPAEIVFAKTGGELIDFNIALSVTEKGKAEQKITTVSGKPLNLTVKPEKPVKTIKGYIIFKARKIEPSSFQLPLNSFFASLFFANPIFAKEHNPKEIEEVLVLMEFEYTDPDGDGIYTADIQAPLVEGEYEIITVMDYEDPDLGQKEIRLIAVVDPEGYVYEKADEKETRIPGAIISLFWLNSETKQYELWPAKEYHQENPQITDATGKYAFLVPNGSYYLKVEAPGYLTYDGRAFQVGESSGIHINIELKTKYWWLKIVDWKTLILLLVILFLAYNFYRDKIRERRPPKVAD